MAQISFSFSGGFWPSSLPLFHGVTRPLVFVAVSMSRSSAEVKELHVDPGRRALVDPELSYRPSIDMPQSSRSDVGQSDWRAARSVAPSAPLDCPTTSRF